MAFESLFALQPSAVCLKIRVSHLPWEPPSPPRILQRSGSLHEYWLVMHFWGYGYLGKWERLLCMARKSQRNKLPQPFHRATQALKSAALWKSLDKWEIFDPEKHAFHELFS